MKLTPLTTRPSLTSRQGMTRTLNMSGRRPRVAQQRQRRRRIEPAVVERAAGDGTLQFLRAGLQQCTHVIERGEAARGDDRYGDLLGQRDRRIEIEALEHAVARDVGIDDGRDAGVLEATGEF